MPSGLVSPRARPATLRDLGERSTFVAGQRIGRGSRRRRRLRPLLGLAPQAVVPEVPVVSGLSEQELASLRRAPGPKAQAAIALIKALLRSGSSLTAEISEIDMSRKDGPVLYTADGVEVRLGTEDWEERLARLEGVLAQAVTEDIRTVDLRFRDQVVLRRGGAW